MGGILSRSPDHDRSGGNISPDAICRRCGTTRRACPDFTFVGTTIFGLIAIDLALKRSRKSTLRLWQIAILAAVGWSVAFMLSLSWPAFEAMTIPGLGLLLAAAVGRAHGVGDDGSCMQS